MSRANEIELYPLNRPFITVSLSTCNDLEESKKDRVRLQPCYFCPSVCSHQSIPPLLSAKHSALRLVYCSSRLLTSIQETRHVTHYTPQSLTSEIKNLVENLLRSMPLVLRVNPPLTHSDRIGITNTFGSPCRSILSE
jgi:hypothetical protein